MGLRRNRTDVNRVGQRVRRSTGTSSSARASRGSPAPTTYASASWHFNASFTKATRTRWLVKGIPATSGRHGGCRLLETFNGALLVGTGDAADESNTQNRKSLGGKVLRLDPRTGKPWPTNPWVNAKNKKKRFVYTYGHRNVQGLAQRGNGSLWSVEHGPDRNDEVNKLRGRAQLRLEPRSRATTSPDR